MVVAVAVVRMMKMPIDQVVDMVSVGNGFVTAARSMNVIGVVP
jgi:hypothetical protein